MPCEARAQLLHGRHRLGRPPRALIPRNERAAEPLLAAPMGAVGFHHSSPWQQMAVAEQDEAGSSDGPVTEFGELARRGLVHPAIINTITKQMRLTTMTDVQTRTINEALSGVDV
jgi:hypothetical protein